MGGKKRVTVGPGDGGWRCTTGKGSSGARRVVAGAFAILTVAMLIWVAGAGALAGNFGGRDILVLDPGHGGIDGGAVSADGVCEKDINLAVCLQIRDMAKADGWKVILTREEDKGLYTDVKYDGTPEMEIQNKRSIRSLKTEDLKARKTLLDRSKADAAVSVHLNSFREDLSVYGAQTFYPASGENVGVLETGEKLAKAIQRELERGIEDGRTREPMSKSDVILMKDPQVPTVIVECGFLSNSDEAEKLQKTAYQRVLAECIYRGLMRGLGRSVTQRSEPMKMVDTVGWRLFQ